MILPHPSKYPDNESPARKMVLVISCVDYRLLDDLVRFLSHENLTNRYYHIAFAGASLCLTEEIAGWPMPKCGRPDGAPWRVALNDHLRTVHVLTGGKMQDIYIVEHRDCGAFEKFLGVDYYPYDGPPKLEEELEDHTTFANALRAELEEWYEEFAAEIEEQDFPPGDPCALPPLDHPPHIHCFLMGLRGEVDRLDAPKSKKKKGKK